MDEFVMVIDTETANNVEQPMPYDFGWAIVDLHSGKIVERYSYVVAEIFLDKELMENAYFSDKIPQYWKEIQEKKRILAQILTIRKVLIESMRKYSIKRVGAYNMGFDKRACNNDIRYLTSSFLRWFFPYGTEFFCIWHMACTSFLNTLDYVQFAVEHGFVSEAGNIQTSAECAYRYLIKDANFLESHTGLEDVEIEVAILLHCLKTGDENMKNTVYSGCWRTVQKIPH